MAEYLVLLSNGRDSPELIGTTSLRCCWDVRTGDLGIVLDRPHWGNGYSGERAAAMLELAFETLGLELVTACYNDGNTKSKRAIEKYVEQFGGQYDGLLRNWVKMDASRIDDVHRYSISREQYFNNRTLDER